MAVSEQPVVVDRPASQCLVVEHHTLDVAVGGEGFRLRCDFLSGKHGLYRTQVGVALEQLPIAGELLDAVDFPTALNFDGDGSPVDVRGENVDGPNSRWVFPPDQCQTVADATQVISDEALELRFDAFFNQPWVLAEFVVHVFVDFVDAEHEEVRSFLMGDVPDHAHPRLDLSLIGLELSERARRRHPIEGLVGPAIGVNEDAPVLLRNEQSLGEGEVSIQASRIVDTARRNQDPHSREV